MRSVLQVLSLTVFAASIATVSHAHSTGKPREIKVAVTQTGFVPSSIKVKAGQPVVLAITRKTDQTCARDAVFPSLGKTFELQLSRTVRVTLHPEHAGRTDFACAMGMMKGQVVVQ